MDNVSGKWSLITGASSGFGVEFATVLAEQNANLVLVARRREPMVGRAASSKAWLWVLRLMQVVPLTDEEKSVAEGDAEYLTLVRSQNTLALFFGFIPANDLDSYRKRLDPIIETLRLP